MPKRPNILLITADDVNWDAVGAYGCPQAALDELMTRAALELGGES